MCNWLRHWVAFIYTGLHNHAICMWYVFLHSSWCVLGRCLHNWKYLIYSLDTRLVFITLINTQAFSATDGSIHYIDFLLMTIKSTKQVLFTGPDGYALLSKMKSKMPQQIYICRETKFHFNTPIYFQIFCCLGTEFVCCRCGCCKSSQAILLSDAMLLPLMNDV